MKEVNARFCVGAKAQRARLEHFPCPLPCFPLLHAYQCSPTPINLLVQVLQVHRTNPHDKWGFHRECLHKKVSLDANFEEYWPARRRLAVSCFLLKLVSNVLTPGQHTLVTNGLELCFKTRKVGSTQDNNVDTVLEIKFKFWSRERGIIFQTQVFKEILQSHISRINNRNFDEHEEHEVLFWPAL